MYNVKDIMNKRIDSRDKHDVREKRWQKKHVNKIRICKIRNCSTILNSYNRNECCSVHNFNYVKKNKIHIHTY